MNWWWICYKMFFPYKHQFWLLEKWWWWRSYVAQVSNISYHIRKKPTTAIESNLITVDFISSLIQFQFLVEFTWYFMIKWSSGHQQPNQNWTDLMYISGYYSKFIYLIGFSFPPIYFHTILSVYGGVCACNTHWHTPTSSTLLIDWLKWFLRFTSS